MAYTSFKTRKALGRRYGTDPALLLEAERLNRQYGLAPGREARALQASQFDRELSFRKSEAELSREAAETSGMVGTIGNIATAGLTLRALTKGPEELFFGKTVTGGVKKLFQGSSAVAGEPAATGMRTVVPSGIDPVGVGGIAEAAGVGVSGVAAPGAMGGVSAAGEVTGFGMGVAPKAAPGIAGSALSLGASLAIELIKDPLEDWTEEQVGTSAKHGVGIAARAGQGALVGSLFGPPGTAIGAGAGAIYGTLEQIFGW